jgi:hypothetical protein
VHLKSYTRKCVTGVQMPCVRTVSAPLRHGGSGATFPGHGGKVGQAAGVKHGDIQQVESMVYCQDFLNTGPPPLAAVVCNTKTYSLRSIGYCSMREQNVAEGLFPVLTAL